MRILIFCDLLGIEQLFKYLKKDNVCGIVAASNRQQYHKSLKKIAFDNDIDFIIQRSLKDPNYNHFINLVLDKKPDLILVNSYSMIIQKEVLLASRLGGINIHGALLPRNRGPHPEQWAILNGDSELGVTMHEIIAEVDAGPIIDQERIPLFLEDTWYSIRERLNTAADKLIKRNLTKILSGDWTSVPQNESKATVVARRHPEDGQFDFREPVIDIYNKIRALLPPMPPAFFLDEKGLAHEMTSFVSIWELSIMKQMKRIEDQTANYNTKVELRILQSCDAELFNKFINDKTLIQVSSSYSSMPEMSHDLWMKGIIQKSKNELFFIIQELVNLKIIGICQLSNIHLRDRSSRLQVRMIDKNDWNTDFAIKAIMLLINFCFKELKLYRIDLYEIMTNDNAIKTFYKCGFCEEGKLKKAAYINEKWEDLILMSKISLN